MAAKVVAPTLQERVVRTHCWPVGDVEKIFDGSGGTEQTPGQSCWVVVGDWMLCIVVGVVVMGMPVPPVPVGPENVVTPV